MAYLQAAVRREQFIAAARIALARDGVAQSTLRSIATEAGVPLGTMQYVFPSKELLLRAVIEDVIEEIAGVLETSAETDRGLAHAIRQGLATFWAQLVAHELGLQLMQFELTLYSLRTAGHDHLARWQYERYADIVAAWCQQAARQAGETCAIPYGQLARVMLAGVDGLILQHLVDPDENRSRKLLDHMIAMFVSLADVERR